MSYNKTFSYQEYITKARELDKIDKVDNLKRISINFYSNFTSELLDAFIKVEFYKVGYLAAVYYFSYGKIEESIFNSTSLDPDITFFHFRTEDFFPSLSNKLIQEKKKELLDYFNENINFIYFLFL